MEGNEEIRKKERGGSEKGEGRGGEGGQGWEGKFRGQGKGRERGTGKGRGEKIFGAGPPNVFFLEPRLLMNIFIHHKW